MREVVVATAQLNTTHAIILIRSSSSRGTASSKTTAFFWKTSIRNGNQTRCDWSFHMGRYMVKKVTTISARVECPLGNDQWSTCTVMKWPRLYDGRGRLMKFLMMETNKRSNMNATKRLKKNIRSSGVSFGFGAKKVAAAAGIRNNPSPENSNVLKNK